MAWRNIIRITREMSILTPQANSTHGFSRYFSKSPTYIVKVGIPEFLNGIGKGVEAQAAKIESEIGDFHKLLVTRTLKLKKISIPCRLVWFPPAIISKRKLILSYAHKYRVGLWRPRADINKVK